VLAWPIAASTQQTDPQPEPPAQQPQPAPPASEPAPEAASTREQEDEGPDGRSRQALFPKVDVFFPEGDFDLRLGRFIKNSFFEGQIKYNFVEGDITAFLRYRYYGLERSYTLGVFDEVEFDAIEKRSNEFTRVRGGLLLVQQPFNFHRRAFLVGELDRISSSREELRFSNERTNTFLRLGYQRGTPDDDRSNAIVGESRARIQRLFSAYRLFGPRGYGWTGALTYSFDWTLGDFDYLKLEFEALKRLELPGRAFLVQRLRGGTFLARELVRDDPTLPPEDTYSIPRSEFFRLDGRENLKGLDDRLRGTETLLTTSEFFFPWFEDVPRRALGVEWQSWYWVLYGGYGTIGFDREIYTDGASYLTDVGLGFQSSFRLRNYTFFLSGLVAQTLDDGSDPKAKLSIKSFH
jgi:hypothetical protein